MRTATILSVTLALAAALSAQQGPHSPDRLVSDLPDATRNAIAGDLTRGQLLVDEPAAGEVWVRGDTYKAKFAIDGATFYPDFGPTAPHHFPVRFAPPQVRLGGRPLAGGAALPRRGDGVVGFDRGGFVEEYRLALDGIEQVFVFAELDRGGELVLDVPTLTPLQPGRDDGGLRFRGELGAVTYGQAVAVDATGARLPLSTRWTGAGIELVVPRSFVAAATLPLVVDPLIATQSATVSRTTAIERPDLAYDYGSNTLLLVYEHPYTSTDSDVYAVRLSASLAILGTVTIDFTTDNWQRPRVASHRFDSSFLVVAQENVGAIAPYWIAGRAVDPAGTVGAQFDIAKAALPGHLSGDKLAPDIGGSGSTAPGDPFLVVWQREYSSTDTDVHARLVDSDGTLRGATIAVANTTQHDSRPAIAKSNVHTGNWQLCYQRQKLVGTSIRHDILGARIRNTGQVLGADEVVLSNTADKFDCAVSSATMVAGFPTAVAFQSTLTPGGATDIGLVLIDSAGAFRSQTNLTQLESIATNQALFVAYDQVRPSIASDGARFVVGYREHDVLNSTYETWVSTVATDASGAFVIHEPRVHLDSRPDGAWIAEWRAPVLSRWTASGARVRYDVAWETASGSGQVVEVRGYLGHMPTGGYAVRQTGCGNLGLVVSGLPAVGLRFTATVTNPYGNAGFLVGQPTNFSFGVCPQCIVGVNGTTVFGPSTLNVDIPPDPTFAGMTFSIQGVDLSLSLGVCLGQFRGSNTVDFTIQ